MHNIYISQIVLTSASISSDSLMDLLIAGWQYAIKNIQVIVKGIFIIVL